MSKPSGCTYTQGHHPSVLRAHGHRTAAKCAAFLLPHIAPSSRILDVGCGPGTITLGLAAAVPDGQVVGIDYSADVIEVAKQNVERSGIGNCEFEAGDACSLQFGDSEFDTVFAHQCLIHLKDPVRALREMGRVCKVGGSIAVREGDLGTIAIYPDPSGLIETSFSRMAAVNRSGGSDPWAGRHLVSWARQAGFAREDIAVSGSVEIYSTPEERRFFGTTWAERYDRSDIGRRIVEMGLATRADVDSWRDAWLRWIEAGDGYFSIAHTEILCQNNGNVGK